MLEPRRGPEDMPTSCDEIGATSVEEARRIYASAPLAEQLNVPAPDGETGDRDEQMIGGAMTRQMAGKAKDAME